jgi:nucleoid-associated protein YejK
MKELLPILVLIMEALKLIFKKDKSSVPLSIQVLQAKNRTDVEDIVQQLGDAWNAKNTTPPPTDH